MKTITIYELLGMVKDGTQPNHIKYRGEEWWWGYDTYTYFADLERTPDAQTNMFTRYVINYCLDDEVEILEEKKIPEKLEDISEIKCVGCKVEINIVGNKTLFDTDTPIVTEHCIYKINQLIKNQKKIIDYLKSKGDK